jgi:hypothetical protein
MLPFTVSPADVDSAWLTDAGLETAGPATRLGFLASNEHLTRMYVT